MDQQLINVIEASTRAILVIDDHPMGGLIICIIMLTVLCIKSGRSKSS